MEPSPKSNLGHFNHLKGNLIAISSHSVLSCLQALVTMYLFAFSMDLPILDISRKWTFHVSWA